MILSTIYRGSSNGQRCYLCITNVRQALDKNGIDSVCSIAFFIGKCENVFLFRKKELEIDIGCPFEIVFFFNVIPHASGGLMYLSCVYRLFPLANK